MSGAHASYDEVPYDSVPVGGSHPARLAAQAALYGVRPPPLVGARILELGCGVGVNALPIAADLPEAEVVAIDLSARQIELARASARALGLTNVRFTQLDLRELDASYGQFDYVIAHGLYSWVPEDVRDRALAICAERLTDAGLAFFTYLTLPGWQLTGAAREFLLFHLRGAEGPAALEAGFDDAIALLCEGVTAEADPRAGFLRDYVEHYASALAGIGVRRSAAIHHDILAPINHAVTVSDFVGHAGRHGLAYLTDAVRWTGQPIGLSDDAWARLAALPDPLVREQYVDYLTMRSMRSTVLRRSGAAAAAMPDPARVRDLYVASLWRPVSSRPELAGPRVETFGYGDRELRVVTPLLKAALVHLHAIGPRAVTFDELVTAARAALGRPAGPIAGPDVDELAALLTAHATVERPAVLVRAAAPALSADVSGAPLGRPLARAQLASTPWVTNHYHEPVVLDGDRAQVLALLDGTRDRAALLDAWLAAIDGHRLGRSGRPIPARELRGVLGRDLDAILHDLARSALLSAR